MTKASKPIMPAATGPPRTRRVLLIGNDPAFQAHNAYLISRAGHHVTMASDGEAALQQVVKRRAEDDQFDLIIDLDLSDTGPALPEQISALAVEVPILFLTNFFDPVRFNELRRMACPDIVLESRASHELLRYIDQLNVGPSPEP